VSGLDTTLPSEFGDGVNASLIYGWFVARGVIGRGGTNVVLRAYDPELDRDVAIKLIGLVRSGTDLGDQRLQREAEAMAKLSHPNVVTVYEMGQVGDQRFIAVRVRPRQ
jgi:serine/threonine protein kinase